MHSHHKDYEDYKVDEDYYEGGDDDDDKDDEEVDREDEVHLSGHTPFNGIKGEAGTDSFCLKKRWKVTIEIKEIEVTIEIWTSYWMWTIVEKHYTALEV